MLHLLCFSLELSCWRFGLGREQTRFEPAVDAHLSVTLSAEMTRSRAIRRFEIPSENGELRIAILNHKPVSGMSADHRFRSGIPEEVTPTLAAYVDIRS